MAQVDPQEIAKFAKLADQWWNKEGKLKTLHDINPCRLQYIQDHTVVKNQLTLDVGCGGGILAESLWQAGALVTAIDMEQEAITAAIMHQQSSHSEVTYQVQDVTRLAEEQPHQYDIITCLEMLEHVPDPSLIIQACAKLLKPQGKLFLSTLNRTAKAYGLAVLGAEYILGILPRGTHDYRKFIKPSELVNMARNNGLTCKDLSGLNYNPFTRQATLCQDTAVNYLAYFQAS